MTENAPAVTGDLVAALNLIEKLLGCFLGTYLTFDRTYLEMDVDNLVHILLVTFLVMGSPKETNYYLQTKQIISPHVCDSTSKIPSQINFASLR